MNWLKLLFGHFLLLFPPSSPPYPHLLFLKLVRGGSFISRPPSRLGLGIKFPRRLRQGGTEAGAGTWDRWTILWGVLKPKGNELSRLVSLAFAKKKIRSLSQPGPEGGLDFYCAGSHNATSPEIASAIKDVGLMLCWARVAWVSPSP